MTGLLVALALAAAVLFLFGAGERGTALALRLTARWSFLPFWLAYSGSALAKLFGPRFDALARRGRELGLAFAAAQLIHIGLILWLYRGPGEGMGFFWIGILCTYLLALFSVPHLRAALGRFWGLFRTMALEYIAIVFAADFILLPWKADHTYPWSYLPFALMLVTGAGLRVTVYARQAMAGELRWNSGAARRN
jgi:hypothetical protein